MTTFWEVTAADIRIRMEGSVLPAEIDDIRKYVKQMDGAVPVEPYPASIAYDESRPDVVLAAAYAYARRVTGFDPLVVTQGISMPTVKERRKPGVVY